MPVGILGKKMGMTQVFDQDGNCIPVTVIQAGPCYVTGMKTQERDQYTAIQLGYDEVPEKKLNLPRKGHLKKAEVKPLKVLREFRVPGEAMAELALGQEVVVGQFKPGDFVDVTGTSKGKGFTGVMKRHNYHGSKASHGVHEYFRHGGSIGGCTPAHTSKGRKMPGRSGAARVTLQNVEVVQVRDQDHLLMVKGGLPGARNSLVMIRKAIKKSK